MQELHNRPSNITTKLTNRILDLEMFNAELDKRSMKLEKLSTEQRQDLESHKLLKGRQLDNLEEKAWEIRDFKEELQR